MDILILVALIMIVVGGSVYFLRTIYKKRYNDFDPNQPRKPLKDDNSDSSNQSGKSTESASGLDVGKYQSFKRNKK